MGKMKSFIADVTTRMQAAGGLPWGLWHDICLSLRPAGIASGFRVTVRKIEEHCGWHEGSTHTVHFELDEQGPGAESIEVGTIFEVWFVRWQHVDHEWQRKVPVADGFVTCVLS